MSARLTLTEVGDRLPQECARVAETFRPNVVGVFLAHVTKEVLLGVLFGEDCELDDSIDTDDLFTRAWTMIREAEEVFYGQL